MFAASLLKNIKDGCGRRAPDSAKAVNLGFGFRKKIFARSRTRENGKISDKRSVLPLKEKYCII